MEEQRTARIIDIKTIETQAHLVAEEATGFAAPALILDAAEQKTPVDAKSHERKFEAEKEQKEVIEPLIPTYENAQIYAKHKPRSRFDLKQFSNAVYFALSTAAIFQVASIWKLPHLLPIAFLFAFFAGAAYIYSQRNRAHPTDFEVSLSPAIRKAVRLAALTIPVPFLLIGACEIAANSEFALGEKDYDADKLQDSLRHFDRSAFLDPMQAKTFMALSRNYFALNNDQKTIEMADRSIALDPEESDPWAIKARAQASIDPLSRDAIANAEKAIAINEDDGTPYGVLAEVYLASNDLDKALLAAQKHVTLHYEEAHALEVRAEILDKLGRTAEAAADRALMATKGN